MGFKAMLNSHILGKNPTFYWQPTGHPALSNKPNKRATELILTAPMRPSGVNV